MVDGHAFDLAVLVEQIDGAPVGDLRHRELRHALERLPVVHRGGQHAAGLGHEALGQLHALDLGDVLEHVHRIEDPSAVGVGDRRGSDDQPALLARRAHDVPDEQRLGWLAFEQPSPGHALQVELATLLVEHQEARHDRARRALVSSLGVRHAEQVGGGLVGEHRPPALVDHRDRLGEVDEHRLQTLLDAAQAPRTGARCRSQARRGVPARAPAPDRPALGRAVAESQHRERAERAPRASSGATTAER